MAGTSKCRSCQAIMRWVQTVKGKSLCLDPEPCADGNIAVEGDVARVLKKDESYDGPRYKSHFATCPGAAAFRRR